MPTKQIRAAVVGAATVLAKELLEELNNSPAAAWDIRLLDDAEGEEAQLSAAGDEAVLIQPLNREALEKMDLIFFAGEGATARELVSAARSSGAAVVDLTGALEQEANFLVRCPWLAAGKRPDLTTLGITVPQPAAVMLALAAQRLQKVGIVSLSATVLEPASQAGKAALDEMHQQTVSLLSFQSVPQEVFDTQVAFNLQTALGEASKVDLGAVAATIRRHLRLILGVEAAARVHFQLVQAPVFHGYTLSALAQLQGSVAEPRIRETLHGGVIQAEDDTAPSNTAVVESGDVLLTVRPDSGDEEGKLWWLWMAADNLRLHARVAVAAGLELAALRPVNTMQ